MGRLGRGLLPRIGVILRRADDERCFILKVLTKAVAVVLVIFAVVCSLSSILSMQTLKHKEG